MRFLYLSLLAAATFGLAVPASGHHSHAQYDASGEIELEGTVSDVRWRNPHVYLYIDVVENGETRTWAFEGAAINQLESRGMRPLHENLPAEQGRGHGRAAGDADGELARHQLSM